MIFRIKILDWEAPTVVVQDICQEDSTGPTAAWSRRLHSQADVDKHEAAAEHRESVAGGWAAAGPRRAAQQTMRPGCAVLRFPNQSLPFLARLDSDAPLPFPAHVFPFQPSSAFLFRLPPAI